MTPPRRRGRARLPVRRLSGRTASATRAAHRLLRQPRTRLPGRHPGAHRRTGLLGVVAEVAEEECPAAAGDHTNGAPLRSREAALGADDGSGVGNWRKAAHRGRRRRRRRCFGTPWLHDATIGHWVSKGAPSAGVQLRMTQRETPPARPRRPLGAPRCGRRDGEGGIERHRHRQGMMRQGRRSPERPGRPRRYRSPSAPPQRPP